MLAPLGWTVVHSLWLSTLVAGLLAVVVSCLGDARARTRYTVSYVALIIMMAAPLVMALALLDPFTPTARQQVTSVVDATLGFSSYVYWRAIVVRAAAGLWIVGAAVAVIRFISEWGYVARLRPGHQARVDEALTMDVDGLAAAMGIRQSVAVFRTTLAHVPMVFGLRTPTILLPDTTASVLNPSQVRAILAHELAHVGRKDYLANLVQIGLETLLWFHPAARWVGRRIRTEREYCCDDLAVRIATRPADYARALAELDDARDGGRLVVAAASGTLLDRIQRIVGEPRPVLTPGRGSLLMVMALFIAAVVVTAAMVVPPRVELDAQLRQRSPAPPGTIVTPVGPTFPRTPR